jgi:hypothetical protein
MDSIGNNGWHRNSAVNVTERLPIDTRTGATEGDPFANAFVAFEESGETGNASPASDRLRTGRWRKRVIGATLCAMVAAVAGVCLWVATGDQGKTRIDLPVRDSQGVGGPAAVSPDDVTAEAIAEIRGAAHAPSPAAAAPSPPTSGAAAPAAPVTAPADAIGASTIDASGGTTAETAVRQAVNSTAEAQPSGAGVTSSRNPERSIRCAATAPALPYRSGARPEALTAPAPDRARKPEAIPSPSIAPVHTGVTLPSFGSLLPVRSLGAIYTLRSGSIARFELTRDARGAGWELKRGVTIVGRLQGGEHDRAYITLVGFIDPESGKLVKIGGEVLGSDGAPGLRGKRRQLSRRWTSVLGRAATSAVSLGQAALSRGGTTIILPTGTGAISPELSPGFYTINRREFVEVPAGAFGYVLISDLPQETRGVDADPLAMRDGERLTDGELAEILSSGSAEKTRAALPRMSPEMKRLATMTLEEK